MLRGVLQPIGRLLKLKPEYQRLASRQAQPLPSQLPTVGTDNGLYREESKRSLRFDVVDGLRYDPLHTAPQGRSHRLRSRSQTYGKATPEI